MSSRFFVVLTTAASFAALSCGSPSAPTPLGLSKSLATAHYVFHYSEGDSVNSAWLEEFHAWAAAALDVAGDRPITYNKYLSRAHMDALIGVGNTNGFADPNAFVVQTIWPIDNHEVVHLLASSFANPGPVALFNEGLAVAHQTNPPGGDFVAKWSGVALDDRARAFRASGQLASIASMVTTGGFRAISPDVSYPEAGSFVKYVLSRFALAKIKTFFQRGRPDDSVATVEAAFVDVFGVSLGQIETDWLRHLDATATLPAGR